MRTCWPATAAATCCGEETAPTSCSDGATATELDGGAGPDDVSTRARRLGGLDRALLSDGEVDELACNGAGALIEADADDELDACAPTPAIHARGRMRQGRRVTLFVRCAPDSAVPCRGRLWIHLQGTRRDPQSGRRLSKVIRFGPIQEG